MSGLIVQIQNVARDWLNSITAEPSDNSLAKRTKVAMGMKLLTRLVGQAIPFATRNGFEVVEYRPGYVKARIPFKPNKNHFNAMYAGALFTVAELPGGVMCLLNFDEQYFPVLAEMNIKYLKPAKGDVTVEFELGRAEIDRIQTEAESAGKSSFTLEGAIKDPNGQVVAETVAYYQVRKR